MAIADKRLYAFVVNKDYNVSFLPEIFEQMTDHDEAYIKECKKDIESAKFAKSITLSIFPVIFVYNCFKNRKFLFKSHWKLVKEEWKYIRTSTKTHLLEAYKDLNGGNYE